MRDIHSLIEENKYDEVFQELKTIITSDHNKRTELLHLIARYTDLKKQIRLDILSINDIILQTNKLRVSLVDFISSLEGYHDPVRKKYISHLLGLFDEPNLFNENIPLSKLYIDPYFYVLSSAIKDDEKGENESKFSYRHINKSLPDELLNLVQGENNLGLKEEVVKTSVTIIFGYPGQGKSSFCKKFIHDYIRKNILSNEDKSIYFIRLRDVRDVIGLFKDPLQTLKIQIENDIRRRIGDDYKIADRDFFKSLLILDGLDELEMIKENSFNSEYVYRLIQAIYDQVFQCNKNGNPIEIIITSRYGRVDIGDLIKRNILVVRLAELSIEQQKKWLENYKEGGGGTWVTNKHIERYYNEKERFLHLSELMEQPILLNMITQLETEPEEDADRSKLYDKLFDLLIFRAWDEGKTLKMHEDLAVTPELLRKLIQETAFAVYQSGREYIHKRKLINSVSPRIRNFFEIAESSSEKNTYLQKLMMSFYLQETLNRDKDSNDFAIEFVHKSLMEFMTAEHIWNTLLEKLTAKDTISREYLISSAGNCLMTIESLFAKQKISVQILEFLRNLIERSSEKGRNFLFERLRHYFEGMMGWDFGYYREHTSSIRQCINTFYGFWTVISSLGKDTNKLFRNSNSLLEEVIYFIKIGELDHISLKGIKFHSISISGVVFSQTDFSGCQFSDLTIVNTIFTNSVLNTITFKKVNFANTWFIVDNLDDCIFENCRFINCYFTTESLASKYIRRRGETEEDFIESLEVKIDNTAFKKCQLLDCILSEKQFTLLESKNVAIS